MDSVLRLFLRVLLVPLGMVMAVAAATLVASVANWAKFTAMVAADAGGPPELAAVTVVAGAVLMAVLAVAVVAMLYPAVVGILLSEALAIRSWMFHALNGGLSIWIGWATLAEFRQEYEIYEDPKVVIAAGLAAGFAYWAVAGWSAGFWKPVFRRAQQVPGLPAGPVR